jgi:hypothetical protein
LSKRAFNGEYHAFERPQERSLSVSWDTENPN